jgi:hypothetical protein
MAKAKTNNNVKNALWLFGGAAVGVVVANAVYKQQLNYIEQQAKIEAAKNPNSDYNVLLNITKNVPGIIDSIKSIFKK